MSDFSRITERPAAPPDLNPSIEPINPATDSHAAPVDGPDRYGLNPGSSPDGAVQRLDLGVVHRDISSREGSVDNRIADLVSEIKGLEKDSADAKEAGTIHNPLEAIRHYCQGVSAAIGAFFMSILGHADPKLSPTDVRQNDLVTRLGIDHQELKTLQDTRRAYEDLDKRISAVENSTSPEQQGSISDHIDALGIHRHTRSLMESLIDRLDHGTAPTGQEPGQSPLPGGLDRPTLIVPTSGDQPLGTLTGPGGATPWKPQTAVAPAETPWLPTRALPNDAQWQPSTAPPLDAPWRPSPLAPAEAPPAHLQDGTTVLGVSDNEADDALVHTQGENEVKDRNTCGIVTQEMVLNHISGTHQFTEYSLTHEALSQGWFDPGGGTVLGKVGNLCEAHGLKVEHKSSSLEDMAEHLAKGDQVIAGVNAGKMGAAWANSLDALGDGSVNHVVWVSGVRVETQNGVSAVTGVIVHDSGVNKSYELSAAEFQQAWQASGCYAVYVSPGLVQRGA